METQTKTIKFIAIYARVSTARQEAEGTIETQISAIREFANKNDYTIVQEYKDDGWSGDALARPALDQLRMDAKKKIWDAVLFYDPDRLARRYSYQELVMDELRELGVESLFVTIPPSKNSEDRLLYGVRGVFAEYERVKIGERFRLGKVRKAKEGHIIASEAPYGYTFIPRTPEKQGYYEINEREAQIVRNIFSWVGNEKLTLRGIVRRLQGQSVSPRWSERGVWSTSTLSKMLRNKAYIGESHYGASYAVIPENPLKKGGYKKIKKTSRRSKPENEWIKIKTPEIIDSTLFARVQKQLKENFDLSMRGTKNEYLLARKIWCPCGCTRAGEGQLNGRYRSYRCTNRVKSFPLPPTCKEKGLNAIIADELVWGKITELMSSPKLLTKQAERWLDGQNNKTGTSAINIEETKKEIAKLRDQEDRFARAYGTGAISLDQLKEYTLPIKEKITLFESQIAKAQLEDNRANETVLPKQNEIAAFAQKAADALRDLNFSAKQGIVRSVVNKVVGTKKELHVSGYIPVTNINVFTLHRYRGSSECG